MKIAVIAPHMDDEVLGAGGTIAKHVDKGDEVSVCIVANRAYNHKIIQKAVEAQKNAAYKAKEILGYKELIFFGLRDEQLDEKIINTVIPIENFLNKYKPEIVYLNHRGDINQDHRAVFQASMIACRTFAADNILKILSYEVTSSTEQCSAFPELIFTPNCYVNIDKFLDKKIDALKCYLDEQRDFPHPRSVKSIELLAKKRGTEIGFKAAEAFFIVREKIY